MGRYWLRGSWGATWATASSCYVAARVALASAVLFRVYPLIQWHADQSLGVAEPGPVVTRQSMEAFGRISISTLWCCLRCSNLEKCCIIDSGYIFCISAWLLLDELHTFSTSRWTRIQRCLVSIPLQNGAVCSADASGCSSSLRCSQLQI